MKIYVLFVLIGAIVASTEAHRLRFMMRGSLERP
jgi:hypothetical protein